MKKHGNKVVLVILDGWGHREEKEGNAIAQALTPAYTKYRGTSPFGLLQASSLFVGLPEGVMGNSEVGHMNIGAGRRILQDQVRIHESITEGTFFSNPELTALIQDVKKSEKKLHIMGLVSKGNVHSAERHYFSVLEKAQQEGLASDQIVFHVVLDGRDTPPKSAGKYLLALEEKISKTGGIIGSVSGRFYAMDRDNRWERTRYAYQMLMGKAQYTESSAEKALLKAYDRDETDEFIVPTLIENAPCIQDGDAMFLFNFRADRMRQLVKAFLNEGTPNDWNEKKIRLQLCSMTQYDQNFSFPVLFHPQNVDQCIGEVLEKKKCKQFRTAETEKYAHVTFFFNGGREDSFKGEERLLIPSPKVRTYDEVPAMSSVKVTEAVVKHIAQSEEELIVVNFAQPDMVGHTGNFDAAIESVEATDECLKSIFEVALEHGYTVMMTADHGNIEMMLDPITKETHTAHTINPVPFLVVGNKMNSYRVRPKGALCDIAPTILQVLGIEKPLVMTGESLLVKH